MKILQNKYLVLLPILATVLGILWAAQPSQAAETPNTHPSTYQEGLQHIYPYYAPQVSSGGASLDESSLIPLEGDTAAQRVFNYGHQQMGLNELGGIVLGTSFNAVSGINPSLNEENKCGIAAWQCDGERWESLLTFSSIYELDYSDLHTQLLFVHYEMNTLNPSAGNKGRFQDVYNDLSSTINFTLSSGFFMQNYLNQTPSNLLASAQQLYNYIPEEAFNESPPEPDPEPHQPTPPPQPIPTPTPQPPPIPTPAPIINHPSLISCSDGLSSGYIAITTAGDGQGAYLTSLSIRRWGSGGQTTTLIHRCLQRSIDLLLRDFNAQATSENHLGGWVWRSNARQIELRGEHCGTTPYDIYEKPANQCSPPTARPGYSSHQDGLAIDFYCQAGILTNNNCGDAFRWLDCNAARYGLINLPSESWHWYYPLKKPGKLYLKIQEGC